MKMNKKKILIKLLSLLKISINYINNLFVYYLSLLKRYISNNRGKDIVVINTLVIVYDLIYDVHSKFIIVSYIHINIYYWNCPSMLVQRSFV